MDIDVSSLEEIEAKLGKILATNSTEDLVVKSIQKPSRLSSQQLLVWKKKVKEDNIAYLKVLGESSMDIPQTIEQIKDETKEMLTLVQKLDAGVSRDDVDLIVNSRWIRKNTRFEPLIVTEDRDLLTSGHILSSFFGLTLGFLSCFELMRLVGLDEPFAKYCEHYELDVACRSIENEWSKEALEIEVSKGLRKAKIACHPSLRGTGSLLRKIKR